MSNLEISSPKRWADHECSDESDFEDSFVLPTIVTPETALQGGKVALQQATRYSSSNNAKSTSTYPTIILKNLDLETTERQVSNFLNCGGDVSVRVLKGKGMAFVEVKNRSLLDKLLALNGSKFGRKVIAVEMDRKKMTNTSSNKPKKVADKKKEEIIAWEDEVKVDRWAELKKEEDKKVNKTENPTEITSTAEITARQPLRLISVTKQQENDMDEKQQPEEEKKTVTARKEEKSAVVKVVPAVPVVKKQNRFAGFMSDDEKEEDESDD